VRDLHDTLGISEARLRALALRHFGAPTKILLRRARFLRSLALVDYRAGHNSYTVIDPSYHDVSHFLRDAHYFLGTTPRRFRLLSSRH
jgi:methylphosphotriester-DNA--protein-cysteine methyltransferase